MKKILLLCLLFSVLLSVPACAADSGKIKIGFLTRLNITEEEYHDMLVEQRKSIGWQLFSPKELKSNEVFVFYDSLIDIQLALRRGDIDEYSLPKDVAEYVLNSNRNLEISGIEMVKPLYLSFGLKERDAELRDKINNALNEMRADGTFDNLNNKYLDEYDVSELKPVQIEKFDNAGVIRFAVTGDLPPIDYVDEAGMPAGFSTAVLAEIGRRLKMNLEVTDIDAGARTAALASGRVDVVFWYISQQPETARQIDVPDGIILSHSYYEYNKFIHIKFKR